MLKWGVNGDGLMGDMAHYSVKYNGPDYLFDGVTHLNLIFKGLSYRLGSGEFTRFESYYRVAEKVTRPGLSISDSTGYFHDYVGVNYGDTITFTGLNLTKTQYKFLMDFDNSTHGDSFRDNLYDMLRIPSNLPTNIEPADKAAGYFFIYSVSRIGKVFEE